MRLGWEQNWTENGVRMGARMDWNGVRMGARMDWVWGQDGSKAGIVVTTYNVPAEYGVSASYPQLGCH